MTPLSVIVAADYCFCHFFQSQTKKRNKTAIKKDFFATFAA